MDMGEVAASDSGPVGVHPQRSVLFAQVSDSDPRMAFDEGGMMHQFGTGAHSVRCPGSVPRQL
ncbi:MAG: hypothetical protein CM15mP6_4710 [Methanobacteriota archaeon]|nr:MAG: hypothetical protein CM15mP6_4710 [Euryarchaeota archaeon]